MAKAGRPLKFKSVNELQKNIDEYFKSCFEEVWVQDQESGKWEQSFDKDGKPVMRQIRPFTITGLALALDTTRDTLLDYEGKKQFSDTIKRAKEIVHNFVEEQCLTRQSPTGCIFNLKNNFGWKDKTETDSNVNVNVSIGSILDELDRRGKHGSG